jgi:hypothetical protein
LKSCVHTKIQMFIAVVFLIAKTLESNQDAFE